MEKQEYQTLYDLEESHWWYRGLRELTLYFIDKFSQGKEEFRILDAGCGTGGLLKRLTGRQAYGFDFSPEAINFCRKRQLENVVLGSINKAPFASGSFDLIASLDVLYHAGVEDDQQALKELNRLLKKDGALILNLVAYDFLRSKHDVAVHTKRRYTVKGLRRKAEAAGFVVERITYRNTILFPLAFIKRISDKLFSKNQQQPVSDLVWLPNWLNKFFTEIIFFENRLLSITNFPFGLSVFAILRKNEKNNHGFFN